MTPDRHLPQLYVQPGELCVATEPSVIRTLLGSCVGILFYAPRNGVAALSHAMLPRRPAPRGGAKPKGHDHRYVDCAVADIADQFAKLGVAREEVVVKVFGGADVLPVHRGTSRPTVGRLNCEAAKEVLEEMGFHITASSLGGNQGVQLWFNTATGEVRLRRMKQTHASEAAAPHSRASARKAG